MVALGTINEWQPPHGPVTTWLASPAAQEAALAARRSDDLRPSYQRSQHLVAARDSKAKGRPLPRLMVVAWEIPGVCDIPAMTAAINAHVRRHDAYHDWFEFENDVIVRRTIDHPETIDFIPVEFGDMDTEQIRTHALTTTPETLEWGCFTFGIVQHTGYFTFYASLDHLYIDGMSAGLIFLDIHLMYQDPPQALEKASEKSREKSPPESEPDSQPAAFAQVASYRDYAARQRERVAGLTLSSPEIKDWIKFAQGTEGRWPDFPLPLGDTSATNAGDFLTVDVLDATETESFDTACGAADARFSGGILACAALAERELTGTEVYRGFAPFDTRTPGIDTMTVGWFASLVPITVATGNGSFTEAARAAQASFDASKRLAGVPFDRVLELATPAQLGIEPGTRPATMVSFIDVRKIPVAALFEETNFGSFGDSLSHGGINIWITRHAAKTTATISFPDNPVARRSVHRYVAALKAAFARAVKTTSDWVDAVADHANSGHGMPVIRL
jgi:mycolipenoyl-CoA---2-(long-chain-fatty acyl)-trehalose mycolipenoyltransferase / long-chain-acyl-CoA---trehalose acyltransferase